MVRKVSILLLAFAMFSASIMAEESFGSKLSVGLDTGLSITLTDYADEGIVGLPVMAKVLYRLDQTFDIPNFGTATFDVGVKTGYLHLFSAEFSTADFVMYTIPFLPYARAISNNIYLGYGMGIHAWFMDAYVDGKKQDTGSNGLEFCALGEVGYMYELTDAITLSGGIGFYSVDFESDDEEASQSIMVLTIGAEYAL